MEAPEADRAQHEFKSPEAEEDGAVAPSSLRSNSFGEWCDGLPPELASSSNQKQLSHSESVLQSSFVLIDPPQEKTRNGAASQGEAAERTSFLKRSWINKRPSFLQWLWRSKTTSFFKRSWINRKDKHGMSAGTFDQAKGRWRMWCFIAENITFYRLHFLYFVFIISAGTVALYLIHKRRPSGSIPFIDAVFMSTSAACVVGLNSIDMEELSVPDQVIIMFLIMLGGQVFTSLLPVLVRRYFFHRYIQQYTRRGFPSVNSLHHPNGQPQPLKRIAESEETPRGSTQNLGLPQSKSGPPTPYPNTDILDLSQTNESVRSVDDVNNLFAPETSQGVDRHRQIPFLSLDEVAGAGNELDEKARKHLAGPGKLPRSQEGELHHSHTWSGETAKSQGQKLKLALDIIRFQKQYKEQADARQRADDQRSEDGTRASEEDMFIDPSKLRTQEYRALQTLSWLVPAYLVVTQFLAFVVIQLNFAGAPSQRQVLDAAGISSPFFAAFQSVASFQNAGLVLLSTSLADFNKAVVLLLTVGTLILLGNTMYAPTMRGIIYGLYRISPPEHKSTFKYLLDHPRKCYTHLFPWNVTKWLVLTVIAFNATELFFFCVLDWTKEPFQGFSSAHKLLLGLFQSLNTRSSGFLVLNISELSPAMLVLYVVMMYVAVYPVYLSRQSSREQKELYDEADIAIFAQDSNDTKIVTQSRKLLLRDSAMVFFGLFIICIVQTDEIASDPNFSIFNLMFEVVSAYGNVGLSVGYTCIPSSPEEACVSPTYSLSGAFKPMAKLVIVFLMLLGRHRGLPDNIDAAVTIPARNTFKQGLRRPIQVEDIDPVELLYLMDRSQHGPRKSWTASSPTSLYKQFSSAFGGPSPTAVSPSAAPRRGFPKSQSMPSARHSTNEGEITT